MHMQCRGSTQVEGRAVKIAGWSSAYSPVLAAALGWCFLEAFKETFGTVAKAKAYTFDGVRTPFLEGES